MDKLTLHRFFSNETTQRENEKLLEWLESDPANRAVMLKERRIFDAAILNAPAGNSPALQSRRTVRRKRNHLWREIGKAAAVIVLAVGVAVWIVRSDRQELMAITNTITIPAGQRMNITLPDGTKVAMNSMSEIVYPSVFGERRSVKLKGEAYFDVVADSDRPFVVEGGRYNVEVVGTSFNMDANRNADKFSVSLIEGVVRVRDVQTKQALVLRPNEYASVDDDGYLRISSISDFDEFRWREGLFCFRNAKFDDLIEQIEMYYDVKVVVKNKALSSQLIGVGGKVRIADGVEHMLKVLQKYQNFKYIKDGALIYIE